jgi:hypothetical protein
MSFIPEKIPECLPERDPATIYGPMGAHVPKDYKPGDAMKAGLQGQDLPAYAPKWEGVGFLNDPPLTAAQVQAMKDQQGINAYYKAMPKNPYKHGTRQYFEWELDYVRNRPFDNPATPVPGTVTAKVMSTHPPHATDHVPRILELTIRIPADNRNLLSHAGLSMSQEIRFSDLASTSQAEAIWATIEELNWSLSSALNALNQP